MFKKVYIYRKTYFCIYVIKLMFCFALQVKVSLAEAEAEEQKGTESGLVKVMLMYSRSLFLLDGTN